MRAFLRLTPPVLFSPCLGALGLGLAWRRAPFPLGVPAWIGEAVLALAGAVFLACLGAYLVKLAHRPGAILGDLAAPPARGFPAAGTMCLMLLAAALAPHAPGLALPLWWLALTLHGVVATLTVWAMWRGRAAGFAPLPVLYLPFVGAIAAPIGGVPLGEQLASAVIVYGSMIPAAGIAAVTLWRALSVPVPPPLRPAQAIHLAPLSLIGTGAALIGHPTTFMLFFLLALLTASTLALRARWMAAAGFGPAWGAFTFPVASFAGLCMIAETLSPGFGAAVIGVLALGVASLVVPYVLVRMLAAWAAGRLVPPPGAAAA